MDSTKQRMVLIAAMVCFFAVGMAGLLNFFKYRSTADGIVTERLLVIGHTIENSIQQSLSLGLQFSGLDALPAMMERERANDDLILSVEVFDIEGHPLYATGRAAGAREMPASWHHSKWIEAAIRTRESSSGKFGIVPRIFLIKWHKVGNRG